MCLCLRKSAVEELLKKNNLSYNSVTAFIMGSDKTNNWNFKQEMESDPIIFPKNVEQKLVNFFDMHNIEVPKTAWVEAERRGTNSLNSSPAGKETNNTSPAVRERLYELGWKNTLAAKWFAVSPGKLNNILGRHSKFIDSRDKQLLAFITRLDERELLSGGKSGVYHTSDFIESPDMPCNYYFNKTFWDKFDVPTLTTILEDAGLPKYFYQLLVTGHMRCPKSVGQYMIRFVNRNISDPGPEINTNNMLVLVNPKDKPVVPLTNELVTSSKKLSDINANDLHKAFETVAKAETIKEEDEKKIASSKSSYTLPPTEKPIDKLRRQAEEAKKRKQQDNMTYDVLANVIVDNKDKLSAKQLRDLATICKSLAKIKELI